MSDYFAKLRTDAWRTSSARYNAARRLKRKELFSTISLAFFSVLTIAMAVIQKVYSVEMRAITGLDNYVTSLSILAGIFIIVISLMEWGSRNGSNADALFKNAEELNSLQRSIHLEILKPSWRTWTRTAFAAPTTMLSIWKGGARCFNGMPTT